ncbi:MAG TPA: proprotein convertase P-domain-containing protein, partial [Myxococcota bacterium]|nr:proprotein convertase P-domain-containing protein [Myxococcota bacterium]
AWALAPNSTREQIREAVVGGVDPLPALAGKVGSGGRLNAVSSLRLLGMNVAATSPQQDEFVALGPLDYAVVFTFPFVPESVSAEAFQVNGLSAETFHVDAPDTITFSFGVSPVTVEGQQEMRVVGGTIRREYDADPVQEWYGQFYYDQSRMALAGTTPALDAVLAVAPGQIELAFDEPLLTTSVQAGDLRLSEGTVLSAAMSGDSSVIFQVAGLTRDGLVSYTIPAGALADAHGNPSPAFSGQFVIDDPLIERYAAVGLPQPIPDAGTISFQIEVADLITIADLDIELTITHTWVSDLDVFLIGPDGVRVELFTDVGGSGDNFTRTILDDEASAPIASSQSPFTGRFRPESPLAAFDGYNAAGTWTLEITDDYAQDIGSLVAFSLVVEEDVDIAPRVSSVQPIGRETDLWVPISSLSVRFSEVMAAATVTDSGNWTLVAAGDPMFAAILNAFEQTGPRTESPSAGIFDSRFMSLMSSIRFSARIAWAVQGTANMASRSVDVSSGLPAAADISAAFS